MESSKLIRLMGSALMRNIARYQSGLPKASPEVQNLADITGIQKIDPIPKDPMHLFKSWFTHHSQLHQDSNLVANVMNVSTASKDGRVNSRSLILRRLDEDGFVIMTDNRSSKSQDLKDNPNAAFTFLWINNVDGLYLARQIRIAGKVIQLETSNWIDVYDSEPLFCKIRAYVCHQGQPVDWDTHKKNHDDLLAQYESGKHDLKRPDHVVAYKLFPTFMDFYESHGLKIADRLKYVRHSEINKNWECSRIAA
uniref:pyridoxal 5'-phosphate synthase n=1 Tax=Cacopsylla melanoneura TaxID=428564 RepID=A0A8D9BR18_9HEMI